MSVREISLAMLHMIRLFLVVNFGAKREKEKRVKRGNSYYNTTKTLLSLFSFILLAQKEDERKKKRRER
jgi:hypothetical protein